MNLTSWLVVFAGLLIIGGFVWSFLAYKKKMYEAKLTNTGYQEIEIFVKKGYSPDRIMVHSGKPVRLTFIREERSAFSEMVIIPDFGRIAILPFGKNVNVEFFPTRTGSFTFYCQMNKYKGTLIVKD